MQYLTIVNLLHTRGKLNSSTQVAELQANGFKHVISLTAPGEPNLEGWDGYTHISLSDGKNVPVDVVEDLTDRIVERIIKLRHKTLVMCRAGRNRTGLIVCICLVKLLKISGEEALRLFRERRPRGVANPHFEEFIINYQRKDPAE